MPSREMVPETPAKDVINSDTSGDVQAANANPHAAMYETLEKIRTQVKSGLPNQRQPALLLCAIEDAIREQSDCSTSEISPVAYFGSLSTMLETRFDEPAESEEGIRQLSAMLTSICYLLQFVMPCVNGPLLRLKFTKLAACFIGIFDAFNDDQPLIRSVIGCVEPLLVSQSSHTWSEDIAVKSLYSSILNISVDGRAKMRKSAERAISTLLANPPPPSVCHPASPLTIDFFTAGITEFKRISATSNAKERKEVESDFLHVLVTLKDVIPVLAMQGNHEKIVHRLKELVRLLLEIPRQSANARHGILTQWIMNVLESLLSSTSLKAEEGCFPDLNVFLINSIIRSLLEISPSTTDTKATMLWLGLMAQGMTRLSILVNRILLQAESPSHSTLVIPSELEYARDVYPQLVHDVFMCALVEICRASNSNQELFKLAQPLLHDIIWSISTSMVPSHEDGMDMQTVNPLILAMMTTVSEKLLDPRQIDVWPLCLSLTSLFLERVGSWTPNCVDILISTLRTIRDSKTYAKEYQFKEELDGAFCSLINAVGLEYFLNAIPLNMLNEFPEQPKRPYLLATIMSAIKLGTPHLPALSIQESTQSSRQRATFGRHSLVYACETIVPLANELFERSTTAFKKKKNIEGKLFETLAIQTWGVFDAVCASKPKDLEQCFPSLSAMLQSILSSTDVGPFDRRPSCCNIICNLVDCYNATQFDDFHVSAHADISDDIATLYRNSVKINDKMVIMEGWNQLKLSSNKLLTILCSNAIQVNKAFVVREVFRPKTEKTKKNKVTMKRMDVVSSDDEALEKDSMAQERELSNISAKSIALQQLQDKERIHFKKAIEALLVLTDIVSVRSYFMSLMKKLLQLRTQIEQFEQENTADRNAMKEAAHSSNHTEMKCIADRMRARYPNHVIAQLIWYSIMDLLIILLPATISKDSGDDVQCHNLFYRLMLGQMSTTDSTVQKRTYKALNLFLTLVPKETIDIADLVQKIMDMDVMTKVSGGSKKSRIDLIASIANVLFSEYDAASDEEKDAARRSVIEFTSITLPEVMLATKETSEKTREAAFDCLVRIGNLMKMHSESGEKGLWPMENMATCATGEAKMDESGPMDNVSPSASISLREYVTMVVAGLAGTTVDMRSSSISTISRFIFEFHATMDDVMLSQIIDTVLCMMETKNKEILKAAIGFIKVIVVCVPQEILERYLETIVSCLLQQSHDNHSHFRLKVKHIFERLMSKFSYEAIIGFVPDADKKLINNIRKAKRSRKHQTSGDTSD